MAELPPPVWPTPNDAPAGRVARWRARPRWQRWTAYGSATLLGLAGLGAAAGDADEPGDGDDAVVLAPASSTVTPTTPTTASTTASTTAPITTTPTTMTTPTTSTPPTTMTTPTTTTTTTMTTTTTTTPAPPTTVAAAGSLLAADVLQLIVVADERGDGYDRQLFRPSGDLDGDGCDTRAEVLVRDSLTPAQVDPFGCGVVAGDWYSAYDGVTVADPGEVQVDHVVALKEAWDSGAWEWDPTRREAFANDLDDPRTLRAVTADANQAKGDRDPSNWIPPNPDAICGYLGDWIAIKARWRLTMDQSERGRIANLLEDRCPGWLVAPWPATPPPVPASTVPSPQPLLPDPRSGCDASYPDVCIPPPPPDLDCGDIPHRRFTVLPPDPHRFDGNDDDGIGCES